MSTTKSTLKRNQDLGNIIEIILSQIEIEDDNQRALLFTAFLKNGLSHFYSMNILIKKKVYHSAFAFTRIFFDNIVRGEYSIYILDDSKINEMFTSLNDWNFPNAKDMCKQLDTFFSNTFFDDIRTTSYGMMCDFTHTSNNQIARWFNEDKGLIESNYTRDEIIDLLEGNFILMERFAKNYIAFIKTSELLNNNINL